tara:strand:- start:3489 stop:3716 length:228 start_codon:yes stop_codon:yes gene_type:complete
MNKQQMDKMIQDYIDNGGAVTMLREATKKDIDKSHRSYYHREKAVCGSERSKNIVENQKKKESHLIFSRDERWSK